MDKFLPATALGNLVAVVYDRPGASPKEEVFLPDYGTFFPGVPVEIPRRKAEILCGPQGNRWMRKHTPAVLEPEPLTPADERIFEEMQAPHEPVPEPAPEPTPQETEAPEKSGALNISKKVRKKHE